MKTFIGFKEALALTLSNVCALDTKFLPLHKLTGRVFAEDIISNVDSPSINASLMDGYAVISEDLTGAGNHSPASLKIIGNSTAGKVSRIVVSNGSAVRITTGAPIPDGATAVIPEESCREKDGRVECFEAVSPGKYILEKGADIQKGNRVAQKGEKLNPALLGLMATAGLEKACVYRMPRVAVLATGDELIAPGQPLSEGKLYAGNMVEICSWLSLFGFSHEADLILDRENDIKETFINRMPHTDAFITSGGIWGSEKDFLKKVLENIGWEGVYHRVRISPGKGVAFGLLGGKPVFCLPGGPPSNEMAFLQLVIPGLMKMKGDSDFSFVKVPAYLNQAVGKRDPDWTRFVHARVENREGNLCVQPLKLKNRMQSMAKKDALICIPEGCEKLNRGDIVDVQILASS